MVQLDLCLPSFFDSDVPTGIERAADLGIDAVEFYDMTAVDVDAVREAAAANDVTIVSTVASGVASNGGAFDAPAITDPTTHDDAVADLERSLETAAALESEHLILTVGPDQPDHDARTQRRAIVDVLRAVAPTAESTGVTIVVEPLNAAVSHPGYFLTDSDTAFELVERVDSPNVAVLYDVFHQQITEGNVIETIEGNLDLIGHMHFADVPGRHEPGTGEINYSNVFRAIEDTDYDGFVGAELDPTGPTADIVADLIELADPS